MSSTQRKKKTQREAQSQTSPNLFDAPVESTENPKPAPPQKSWRVFLTALIAFTMLWFSFPPFGLWWMAWFAPAPIVWIILAERLPGQRPYRQLYFAGLIYSLAQFYFVPIPHPALWLGWLVLGLYLAFYVPLLVGVSRTLVGNLKLPAMIFIPIVWTGLEWVRGHFATGLGFACLSHTQYEQPILIQLADIFGAYTVTFAIVWVSVGVAFLFLGIGRAILTPNQSIPASKPRIAINVLGAIAMMTVVLVYGNLRLNEPIQYKSENGAVVGLIQTSEDVVFRQLSEEEIKQQLDATRNLSIEARQTWSDLDLLVWPESASIFIPDYVSNDLDNEITVDEIAKVRKQFWTSMTGYRSLFEKPLPLLTGGHTVDPANDGSYNSCFLIGSDGLVSDRYFKNHLVMFGEYIPFGQQFPVLEDMAPMRSLTFGDQFQSMKVGGVNLAPNICFESTVPHFIRRQVNTLAEQGNEPDVLVNLTNDGWFFGTSCLDLHLACNVMRAVEMRKPHLVSSNTGISANIDSCGRILEAGPKRDVAVIRAAVMPIKRDSFYREFGEMVPMIFGIVCGLGFLISLLQFGSGTGNSKPAVPE